MSAKQGLLRWLSAFIAFDLVVLGALLAPQLHASGITPGTVTGALASVLTAPALLLLTSLLSADIKAALVFWRPRHALPGHQAFSKHVHSDTRIDVVALEQRVGPFPVDPAEQQAKWYKLYRAHKDDNAVLDANRRYLLFRDLATVSAFSALGVPVALKLTGFAVAAAPAGAVFALQYILAAVAAQQAGIRLIKTVLAIESTQPNS
ncbi:hypothetical protein LJB71_08775 [Thermomonas sp. S9]|uniref:hypothetical protein n=1 Tax=Thermomonas sp. S9 TaxID=2885203 RepID=UPI00086C4518|nr:hypothetical protein [Thermomonas sp. S9]MCR6496304.1 hypothetical protein [Thermomonas sp. S9]ODU52315.1 MAG: hypothetical protein ABS98_04305 [Xanthomonadaceae bacterium SCN 69-48]